MCGSLQNCNWVVIFNVVLESWELVIGNWYLDPIYGPEWVFRMQIGGVHFLRLTFHLSLSSSYISSFTFSFLHFIFHFHFLLLTFHLSLSQSYISSFTFTFFFLHFIFHFHFLLLSFHLSLSLSPSYISSSTFTFFVLHFIFHFHFLLLTFHLSLSLSPSYISSFTFTFFFLHFIFHNWRFASDGENIKTHQNIKSAFSCSRWCNFIWNIILIFWFALFPKVLKNPHCWLVPRSICEESEKYL